MGFAEWGMGEEVPFMVAPCSMGKVSTWPW